MLYGREEYGQEVMKIHILFERKKSGIGRRGYQGDLMIYESGIVFYKDNGSVLFEKSTSKEVDIEVPFSQIRGAKLNRNFIIPEIEITLLNGSSLFFYKSVPPAAFPLIYQVRSLLKTAVNVINMQSKYNGT